ncbi:TerC family protein, partial [Stenotrophomonas acidaminiphila]|nr:TerC family protein [Stenotrophomonas acidaminiphila]
MSFEFLADPNVWVTLFMLSALEIVLGIDNLVFISIAVARLPEHRRPLARRVGMAVACITR